MTVYKNTNILVYHVPPFPLDSLLILSKHFSMEQIFVGLKYIGFRVAFINEWSIYTFTEPIMCNISFCLQRFNKIQLHIYKLKRHNMK